MANGFDGSVRGSNVRSRTGLSESALSTPGARGGSSRMWNAFWPFSTDMVLVRHFTHRLVCVLGRRTKGGCDRPDRLEMTLLATFPHEA
jgi:hypothetical protein